MTGSFRPDDDIVLGLLRPSMLDDLTRIGRTGTRRAGAPRGGTRAARAARIERRLIAELATWEPGDPADHGVLHLVNETIGLDTAQVRRHPPGQATLDAVGRLRAPVAVAALAYIARRRRTEPSIHARELLAGPVPPGFERLHQRFVEERQKAIEGLAAYPDIQTEPGLAPVTHRPVPAVTVSARTARLGRVAAGLAVAGFIGLLATPHSMPSPGQDAARPPQDAPHAVVTTDVPRFSRAIPTTTEVRWEQTTEAGSGAEEPSIGARLLRVLSLPAVGTAEGGALVLGTAGMVGTTIARRRAIMNGRSAGPERGRQRDRDRSRGHVATVELERLLDAPLPECWVEPASSEGRPLTGPRTERPALPPAGTNSPDWMPPSLRSFTEPVPDAAPRPAERPTRDTSGRSDGSLDR